MAQITIIDAGPYTTIQDAGRTGFQAQGVPEGGAMDGEARICGNWLVGNPPDAAGLEVYVGGLRFTVNESMMIALAGPVCDSLHIQRATGKHQQIEAGKSVLLAPDDEVYLPPMRDSNLGFIAFSGTFSIAPIYGSLSTSLNARLGGLEGRRIEKGDGLNLSVPKSLGPERQIKNYQKFFEIDHIFRIVLGPQDYAFTADEIDKLVSQPWVLSPKMDRMGMRLSGPAICHRHSADILSDGLVKGAVQVPGDGQPIIMMADHQTTGGYTKIACVISSDLSKLSRLHPHKKITFQTVTQAEAEQAAQYQAKMLETLILRSES